VIGALLVIAAAATGGTVATYLFDPRAPGYARVATGTVLGLTAVAFAGLAAATVLGLGPGALAIAVAVPLLPLGALRGGLRARVTSDLRSAAAGWRGGLGRLGRDRSATLGAVQALVYVACVAIVTWAVADRNLVARDDGLFITNVGNLGDLPYHTAITASFAYADNFPPQNPVFVGSGLAYHYVVDFLAAVFIAAGSTLRDAMFMVTLVLGVCLVPIVHRWARDLTGSVVGARVAVALLFLSGGLGWLVLFGDSRQLETGLYGAFFGTDSRYTIQPDGILRFQNAVTGLLVPQRALLLGMAVAVIVFTLIWHNLPGRRSGNDAGDEARPVAESTRRVALGVAGVLTGLLPLIHIHTFGVVLGTAFLIAVAFREWRYGRWRAWVGYVVAAVLIGLPVLIVTAQGNASGLGSYLGVQVGWEVGQRNIFEFWLVNTGLFIPLLLIAYIWDWSPPLVDRKLLLFTLPFMAWFIVANLVRLAPWPWDNIKLLIYWWLGGVPVVAVLLARLWSGSFAARTVTVVAVVVLTAAGALDIARSTVGPNVYQEWDADGIAFAEQVRATTPVDAVVLADPIWNSPILLTGRQLFMGYDGWLFANGLPWVERGEQTRTMYAGGDAAVTLLKGFGIDYVMLGPQERRDVAPNGGFLAQYPVAAQVGDYVLYKVGS
jgi:hypothetical protein